MNNHQCQACIVTCIDFRLQPFIDEWIGEHFQPRTFDRVALAGGVKNMDIILDQINTSSRLHEIKRAVLTNHEDCGAYGSENFPDSQTEHQKHQDDLANTATKIREQHPNLQLETYFLHLDGTFEKI